MGKTSCESGDDKEALKDHQPRSSRILMPSSTNPFLYCLKNVLQDLSTALGAACRQKATSENLLTIVG